MNVYPKYHKCLQTGQLSIEVVSIGGTRHTIQRSYIHSLHEDDEDGTATIHTHTFILQTGHSYPELRDMLWPTEVEDYEIECP